MAVIEREKNGGGRKDPERIENEVEKKFFVLFSDLLNKKLSGATIVHEPTLFEIQEGQHTVSGTLPDFLITRPDGRKIYVEITISKKNNGHAEEAKIKQKRIMQQLGKDIRYVVLYRENLEAVQKAHPVANFFPSFSSQ